MDTTSLSDFLYSDRRYPARPRRPPHGQTYFVLGGPSDICAGKSVPVTDGFDAVGNLFVNRRMVWTRAFSSSTVALRSDGEDIAYGSNCELDPDEWEDFMQRVSCAGSNPDGPRWICPTDATRGVSMGISFCSTHVSWNS